MKLLVIGGTGFIGRHLSEAAVGCRHSVTVFSRGQTRRPPARAGVAYVRGDRETDLDVVTGDEWDAVIDVYGHLPQVVSVNAMTLASCARRYVFISTTAVYAAAETPPSEDSPLRSISDQAAADFTRDDDITGEAYGPLKVRCEAAVEEAFSGAGADCPPRPHQRAIRLVAATAVLAGTPLTRRRGARPGRS